MYSDAAPSTLGSGSQVMGLLWIFGTLFSHSSSYIFDSVKLLILGSVIEAGRRLCQWLIERFRIQYRISAHFDEGDPAYEWILLFLTQENVWRRSCDFHVSSKTSARKWGVGMGLEPDIGTGGNADYVPTYERPQLFRWKGHWVEIKVRARAGLDESDERSADKLAFCKLLRYVTLPIVSTPIRGQGKDLVSTFHRVYSLDMSVLSSLVEEARRRYIEINRPHVIIHLAGTPSWDPETTWCSVKSKVRRPPSSIILQQGVIDSLLKDMREFIDTEEWYIEAGIPHRRGYLLYGPPGTGKTSTIYALAGELGLEIYSLSLASTFVDDSFLQRAVSDLPKHSILLIEDIDCAFASRDDEEDPVSDPFPGSPAPYNMAHSRRKPAVTLSGLLNVIDGVGSEEGKLFFATTNYLDRLDPALLRPGRIDKKIQYNLATRDQAHALFTRFFPASRFGPGGTGLPKGDDEKAPDYDLPMLADTFASAIPEHEFSTAELQGYLLTCKLKPAHAASAAKAWVAAERLEKEERELREDARKDRLKEARARKEAKRTETAPIDNNNKSTVAETDAKSLPSPSPERAAIRGDSHLSAPP